MPMAKFKKVAHSDDGGIRLNFHKVMENTHSDSYRDIKIDFIRHLNVKWLPFLRVNRVHFIQYIKCVIFLMIRLVLLLLWMFVGMVLLLFSHIKTMAGRYVYYYIELYQHRIHQTSVPYILTMIYGMAVVGFNKQSLR